MGELHQPVKGQSCEDDRCRNPDAPVSYCLDCDTTYCDDCWSYAAPHKAGKVGRDGFAHEKSNYQISKVYHDILHPPSSPHRLREMHEHDFDTLWFGVTKDDGGHAKFVDHGRYAALIADSPSMPGKSTIKFPQLVSFVGVTNAGKSTLINMLIERHQLQAAAVADGLYPSPVVGSVTNDKVPTSGDVHLYADPITFCQDYPMLYADCEGLEGGECLPYGSQSQVKSFKMKDLIKKGGPEQFGGKTRNIRWAVDDQTKKREYAVTELYPRLLYTFSDVVVFVLRNPKTFQSSVLGRLLKWGAAALEKSINQPTLPHAIIVLNATDVGVDHAEWDPKIATENLLATAKNAFHKVSGIPELRELVEEWSRKRNVEIRTVQQLIERYYSSFTVVRIPAKGRYSLMDQQALKLHETISVRCKESFNSKRRARMLSNSDELNGFLQAAFDHFTTDLDRPFNFIEASLRNNPLPENFGDHIFQLALAIRDQHQGNAKTTGQWIFNILGQMVASCIMLDCVRYRKGTYSELFVSYRSHLEDALLEFCELSWPCSYVSRKQEKCTVVRAGHVKGHQNAGGKVIGSGEYQSNFQPETFSAQWIRSVQTQMEKLYTELQKRQEQSKQETELRFALDIHKERMSSRFDLMGTARRYVSHSTCFCCLQGVPEHGLPCGHVLCSSCVQAYGERTGDAIWTLRYCPLHFYDRFLQPWKIWFKPAFAGVRILCLDGGGIRGIVELQVLKSIEAAIGCGLPIQAFFDLIIGTSTGGIIALALGVKQWSVDKCIKEFISLCSEAFTPKPFKTVAGLFRGTKYRTKPLYNALSRTLGEGSLFGGKREHIPEHAIRVGVTATSGTGREALLISNYGRGPASSDQYQFLRLDDPKAEMRVYEAAAATSAAPTYFKEFYHERSQRTYLDGALYYNNPAQIANTERKLLWPDVANTDPDILLSLGTGTHADTIDKELQERRMQPDKSNTRAVDLLKEGLKAAEKPAEKQHKIRSIKIFKILRKRFDNVLDTQIAWRDFKTNTTQPTWPDIGPMPYFRFNPDIGYAPPPFDARDEVFALNQNVIEKLKLVPARADAQRVAFHLIASTFYFSKIGHLRTTDESGPQICTGKLCCRFEDNKLRQLGNFLRYQQRTRFSPYFKVHNQYDQGKQQTFEITGEIIESMINIATFNMPDIHVEIWNVLTPTNISLGLRYDYDPGHDGPTEFPLSGFPRCLATEETEKLTRTNSPDPGNKTTLKTRRTTRRFPRQNSSEATLASTIEETLHETSASSPSRQPSLAETLHTTLSGSSLSPKELPLRSSLYISESHSAPNLNSPATTSTATAHGLGLSSGREHVRGSGSFGSGEMYRYEDADFDEVYDEEEEGEARKFITDIEKAVEESLITEGDRRMNEIEARELELAIELSKRESRE